MHDRQIKTYVHVNLSRGYRGGERQTLLLIQCMANQLTSRQICLVCHPDGELARRAMQLEHVLCVFARSQLMAHRLVSRLKPSLVHAHEARAVHWAFIQWVVYRVPYVITRRISQAPKNNWFTKLCYRKATHVVAISGAIAESLRVFGVDVSAIIKSVGPIRSAPCKTSWKRVDPFVFKILCAAALCDDQKGQSVLIGAMEMLPDDVHVTFLGDGPDKAFLEAQASKTNQSGQIEFRPWFDEVGDLFKSHDLFVLPSRHEGLGSILVDAMQLGLPIVSTNVGGIPDLIKDGETGLLAEGSDVESLAHQIKRMYRSECLRSEVATRAVQSVVNLTPDTMCAHYLKIYQSVDVD